MASRIVAAAAALSSSSPIARLISRRGLAGAADPHAPPKVNLWQDPLSPSKWKEEHALFDWDYNLFVLASLSMWGGLIYGGFKLFSGGKKEDKTEAAPAKA